MTTGSARVVPSSLQPRPTVPSIRGAVHHLFRVPRPRVCRDVLLLVPSFLQHIPALSLFISSILAHVADLGAASLRVLLGDDAASREALEAALAYPALPLAPSEYRPIAPGRAGSTWTSRRLEVGYATLSEVLAPHNLSYSFELLDERCKSRIHRKCADDARGVYGAPAAHNKFLLQFIKKLHGALHFRGYQHVLILDSEGLVLSGPVSLRALVRAHSGGDVAVSSEGGGPPDASTHGRDAPMEIVPQLMFTVVQPELFTGSDTIGRPDPLKLRRVSEACRYLLGLPTALSMRQAPPSPASPESGAAPRAEAGAGSVASSAASSVAWSSAILGRERAAVAWGYQGWIWRRTEVASLFQRVQAEHKEPLLSVASRLFEHSRCYEATLYWEHVANPPGAGPSASPSALDDHGSRGADEASSNGTHAYASRTIEEQHRALDATAGESGEDELLTLPATLGQQSRLFITRSKSAAGGEGGAYHIRHAHAHARGAAATRTRPLREGASALRVVSSQSLLHFLNGTCAYLPTWPTNLEFFSAFLLVPQVRLTRHRHGLGCEQARHLHVSHYSRAPHLPFSIAAAHLLRHPLGATQPRAALDALSRWITHHGVAFLRIPDLAEVRSAAYRDSIGVPGYHSGQVSPPSLGPRILTHRAVPFGTPPCSL